MRIRRRQLELFGAVAGVAALTATGARARRTISLTEVRLFRWANQLPDGAFRAVWAPMQYGTFATVPVVAAVAVVRRRFDLGLAVAVAGTAAWVLAKAVKPVVGRGRPASVLTGVHLRGKEEGDLGFPSGHAAVSAALTLIAWRHVGISRRLASAALAGFVPFARMYVGAHLPLDTLGGSAMGIAIGCLVDLAV
jgi:membrane-associated phospholipid phosphatase